MDSSPSEPRRCDVDRATLQVLHAKSIAGRVVESDGGGICCTSPARKLGTTCPLSPYYDAGWQAWAKGQPTPLLPGPVQHTLLLVPAARGR